MERTPDRPEKQPEKPAEKQPETKPEDALTNEQLSSISGGVIFKP